MATEMKNDTENGGTVVTTDSEVVQVAIKLGVDDLEIVRKEFGGKTSQELLGKNQFKFEALARSQQKDKFDTLVELGVKKCGLDVIDAKSLAAQLIDKYHQHLETGTTQYDAKLDSILAMLQIQSVNDNILAGIVRNSESSVSATYRGTANFRETVRQFYGLDEIICQITGDSHAAFWTRATDAFNLTDQKVPDVDDALLAKEKNRGKDVRLTNEENKLLKKFHAFIEGHDDFVRAAHIVDNEDKQALSVRIAYGYDRHFDLNLPANGFLCKRKYENAYDSAFWVILKDPFQQAFYCWVLRRKLLQVDDALRVVVADTDSNKMKSAIKRNNRRKKTNVLIADLVANVHKKQLIMPKSSPGPYLFSLTRKARRNAYAVFSYFREIDRTEYDMVIDRCILMEQASPRVSVDGSNNDIENNIGNNNNNNNNNNSEAKPNYDNKQAVTTANDV